MKWLNDYAIITIGIVLVVGMAFGLLWIRPVVASGGSDNACTEIGTAGKRTIYRCIDDQTGMVLFGNDAGFMVVVE